MYDVTTYIVSTLKGNSGVTAIVPAANISSGPVDIVTETQAGLRLPQINIFQVGEQIRTVPLGARDIHMRIDIWSRNSQKEVEQIYEAVIAALNFILNTTTNNTRIFWSVMAEGSDQYEGDRRIWHKPTTFIFWAMPLTDPAIVP